MLLDVVDLRVNLPTPDGALSIVRGVSFALERGQTLGIVGESGSGKSMIALSLMGLLPLGATTSGRLSFEDRDLTRIGEKEYQTIRGDRIAMIFQEPMTALNPLHSIGRQVSEPLRLHRSLGAAAASKEAIRLLERVGLAATRARAYPHQLSGGQRQRAMIAMALACGPRLVVADEPTTALDVTVQAQILDLINELRNETSMALILISHDLAVVGQNCERILVLYGGMTMESGPTQEVLARAAHPYTRALLGARPSPGGKRGGKLTAIAGSAPSPRQLPPGCPFAGRCEMTIAACFTTPPTPRIIGQDHSAQCIRLDDDGQIR
jgi:peptide/nickel transport system ATP-binding protein